MTCLKVAGPLKRGVDCMRRLILHVKPCSIVVVVSRMSNNSER
jgi:hypothetical protein